MYLRPRGEWCSLVLNAGPPQPLPFLPKKVLKIQLEPYRKFHLAQRAKFSLVLMSTQSDPNATLTPTLILPTLNVSLIGITIPLDPGPVLQALSALAPSLTVPTVFLPEAQR